MLWTKEGITGTRQTLLTTLRDSWKLADSEKWKLAFAGEDTEHIQKQRDSRVMGRVCYFSEEELGFSHCYLLTSSVLILVSPLIA